MQKKSASSEDVARAAGVSRATVSYVLNGRTDQSIPEKTRSRVNRAAQALSHRPNRFARSLQRGKTHTLGVMMPSLSQSFQAGIMQGIREVCFEQDFRVLLAQPEHESVDGRQVVNLLLEHQVDGLLYVAANDYLAAWGWDAARRSGLYVPEELALAGYGDVEAARFLGLTTIRQHPQQIGRIAIERLLLRPQ